MGNEPVRHHPYLSANSVELKRDDKRKPSIKNMLILFSALAFLVVSFGTLWLAFGRNPDKTAFESTLVQEDGFTFTTLFYKNASTQASGKNNYLIMRDNRGQEISMWATKTDRSLGCGTRPSLDYTPQRTTTILSGCYEDDYKTFATAIKVGRQTYQVNITAEQAVSTEDVKQIFGSVVIDKN